MRTRAWRRRPMWLAAVTSAVTSLAAVPLLAIPMVGSPAAAAEGDERYVAFGDSFVSGPGILPQRPGYCARSERNFPSLVAARLGVGAASFTDASCGGARLDHLWEPQPHGDDPPTPPQLDALSEDTTLVTFGTLGGNDVNLVGLATTCFLDACSGSEGDARHQAIEALRDEVREGLLETRRRAPNADIVVVGYSHYVPPPSCAAIGGISSTEAVYFQGLVDHLSRVLEETAAEVGAGFADMNAIPGVAEHTVCAEPDEQYVRALNTYNDGAPLHPSTCGMAAYAQQVTRSVQALRGEALDEFVDPCPAVPTDPVTPTDPDTAISEELTAAAATLRLRRTCRHDGRRLVIRVRGGGKLVDKAVFKVGRHRTGADTTRPFVVRRSTARLSRHRGKVRARVMLSKAGVRQVHRLAVSRPRCLRR